MSLFAAAGAALWSSVEGRLTEKAADTAGAALDRKELKKQVQALAEGYRDRFEALSLTEEFDFEGLNAFLQEHLWPDVAACFNAPSRDQREAARQVLFASAWASAGANTQAKKDAVRDYLKLFLEIVETYFLNQVDEKEWFLCGRAADETARAVEAFLRQHTTKITEAIRYHNSFAEYIDNLRPAGRSNNSFHYRNADLGFYGRERELEALDSFLNQGGQIRWMAVVGAGGVGKSKLLYHYCAQVGNRPGWRTVWFSRYSCEQLDKYQNWYYPDRLLVVVDYAGERAEQLGDWLAKLWEANNLRRPKRLRLILLERENLGEVTPLWYQTFTGNRERRQAVEQFCADPSRPCLELSGPGDETLGKLVTDYARSEGKQAELTADKLTSVLEKAHESDHDNPAPRPLVTLFIADAMLRDEDYNHWDIPALVENIIERYQDHWRNTVCNGDTTLYDSLQQMLVYATAVGGWDLTELPSPLNAATQTLLASERVLKPLVCAVNEEDTFRGRLSPLEPDMVGEFYVLDYLNDEYCDKTTLAALVQLFWKRKWEFAAFLNRCIHSYCNEPRFWRLFRDGLAVFQPEAKNASAVVLFSASLVNLIAFQPLDTGKTSVVKLETLYKQYPNSDEFPLHYAIGLFNLSIKQFSCQNLKDAIQIVTTLGTLAERHPVSSGIAFAYAYGLLNVSNYQSLEDVTPTIKNLETLAEQHSDSPEIVIAYAQGLFNLSIKQSLEGIMQTVAKLETLAGQHSNSDEIALVYAHALGNLLSKQCEQSSEEAASTADKLGALTGQHPKADEITAEYAGALVNLATKQSSEGAAKTGARLKKLTDQHPDLTEVVLAYAYSLFNLSLSQPQEETEKTIDRLAKLANQYPNLDKIASLCAEAQDSLSNRSPC